MSNKSKLIPIDITDEDKITMLSIFVRKNLLDVSQQVFNDYIKDNTGELDSPLQQWTTAEAALGAAVLNDMVNASLKELADHEKQLTECQHDKVWSNNFLASNPPQYQWVCRNCGEQGTTREYPGEGSSEYDAIINRMPPIQQK